MPILEREHDIHPPDLLDRAAAGDDSDEKWWALYTLSRREKQLMRRLRDMDIAYYGPIVEQRKRSPSGRVRTSYVPLFSNYVFLYGDASSRYRALTTNCVSRDIEVVDGAALTRDLIQIHRLIELGLPLHADSKLQPGARVRIRSGMLEGMEGTVVNRRDEKRFVVAVNFLQQGASVLLEDFEIEQIA